MQTDSGNIKYLVGTAEILKGMPQTPVLPAFSDNIKNFLADLSRSLLNNPMAKQYVDVMSYAYWIRKASLENAQKKNRDCNRRVGRGVAFHIAPSNVPVNFIVSVTSSLLAGNCNIVRVSNKAFPQVDIVCTAIRELVENAHKEIKPYLCIVRYEHSDEITRYISSFCDVRIIWGGNRTIEEIRKAPIPHRAIEMTFADRHSIAIINSEQYLLEKPMEIAKGFYTDTYYTDQNACSSPRMVVWTGNKVEEAKKLFWESLSVLVKRDYQIKPIQAVDKYAIACSFGMKGGLNHLVSNDNYIVRIELTELPYDLMNYKSGSGYFYEYTAKSLDEIVPVLSKECQTISVLGIDKEDVFNLVCKYGVRGVDRIVPLGQTMGLEFIWDGYKMIEAMSRFIYTADRME